MVTIYFTSGKEIEFDYDWPKLAPKFQMGGVRMFAPYPGVLIPLNSQTIERIELHEDEEEAVEEKDEFSEAFEPSTEKPTERQPEPAVDLSEEKEKEKSPQEKANEMLEYMKEMSECTHEKHDIYFSASTVGKNKTKVRRFFPVCAKCGVREKFVKADTLTDEQKENAKEWTN